MIFCFSVPSPLLPTSSGEPLQVHSISSSDWRGDSPLHHDQTSDVIRQSPSTSSALDRYENKSGENDNSLPCVESCLIPNNQIRMTGIFSVYLGNFDQSVPGCSFVRRFRDFELLILILYWDVFVGNVLKHEVTIVITSVVKYVEG